MANGKDRAHRNASGLWESLQRFWGKSHAGDYLGLALLLAAYIVIQLRSEPFHRLFRLDDPRIQYPHADVERVPVSWLLLYALALPLALLLLHFALHRPPTTHLHPTLLGLLTTLLLTTTLTDLFKNAIGRPRPDLLARCQPAPDTPRDALVSIAVCTRPDAAAAHLVQDGWRSFPSGHSSFAFAGLGWLALFCAAQTGAARPRASLAAVLVSVAPLVAAALIAVSRLEDYRHDVFDVVSGSLLGCGVAYGNWRRYFPGLGSGNCAEPFAAAVGGGVGSSSPGGRGRFHRVRDEEEGYGAGSGERFGRGGGEEEEGSSGREGSR